MNVNVNAKQIKTGFGPIDRAGPMPVYPRELHRDVVGYIMNGIKYFGFFPNELKDMAKEIEKIHKRFEAAKSATLLLTSEKGRDALEFIFNGKSPLSNSEIHKKFLAVEQEYKNAFENFKTKYYARYQGYKAKPENNPNGLQKLVNWELENRQRVPQEINNYLQNSLYDTEWHCWKMNKE